MIKRVRIGRDAWRIITESAAANLNEMLGVLLGTVRGSLADVRVATVHGADKATPDMVRWDCGHYEAMCQELALEYPEYKVLGTWHTHPWEQHPGMEIVLTPQLTRIDFRYMRVDEIEIIALAFPPPDWYCRMLKNNRKALSAPRLRRRKVGSKEVRVEAWGKEQTKKGRGHKKVSYLLTIGRS